MRIRVPQLDGLIRITLGAAPAREWPVAEHHLDADPADVDLILRSIDGAAVAEGPASDPRPATRARTSRS